LEYGYVNNLNNFSYGIFECVYNDVSIVIGRSIKLGFCK